MEKILNRKVRILLLCLVGMLMAVKPCFAMQCSSIETCQEISPNVYNPFHKKRAFTHEGIPFIICCQEHSPKKIMTQLF